MEFRAWMARRGQEEPEPAEEKPVNKYRNVLTTVDGKKFGSKKEARYYENVLLPKLQAGSIRLILRQVPFDLPGGIRYIADFCILTKDREFHVIDVKSEITKKNRVYINKKKQMAACWGLKVEEA